MKKQKEEQKAEQISSGGGKFINNQSQRYSEKPYSKI
tara:strand:- start:1963 stop:2073 length:111 start_codon:yes stop_codon:yes gene_type:complete